MPGEKKFKTKKFVAINLKEKVCLKFVAIDYVTLACIAD
jgi:hypothetical protein